MAVTSEQELNIDHKTVLQETLPINFIDNIDQDRRLIYSDTDSSYSLLTLPFSKFDDVQATVEFTQQFAKAANTKYLNIFNTILRDRANINPDFNFMNFKSEVVAYRGFFNAKKFYALGKIWDEGTFYKKLKIKKTGGQILKADCSNITYDMLSEIYEIMTVRTELTDINQIHYLIFHDIKEKYTKLLASRIEEFQLNEFIIPKKWSLSTTKTIPTHVLGAMLYNSLFEDNIRPGESLSMIQIRLNPDLLYKYLEKKYQNIHPSKYQLPLTLISKKLNTISFPSGIDLSQEKTNIIRKFKNLQIDIDWDKIISFNIDMKLEQFKKLFERENIVWQT